MKHLKSIDPDEVVTVWLRTELNSKRFQNDLKKSLSEYSLDTNIITAPNLNNKEENQLRLKVLKDYRSWFKDDIYSYSWELVELTHEDVRKLRYIEYSYWNELSDNTHLAGVAAKNVEQGKVVYDISNDNFWDIAKAMDNSKDFEPVIILEREYGLEIVEGHARATGYLLSSATKIFKGIIGTKK